MKTIIKPAVDKFYATCEVCGCYFSYEVGDVYWGTTVRCPSCDNCVSHQLPKQNKDLQFVPVMSATDTRKKKKK